MKRKMVRKNARYSNGKNAKMKKDAWYSNGKKANLKKKCTLFIQLFLSEIKKCTVFKCSSFELNSFIRLILSFSTGSFSLCLVISHCLFSDQLFTHFYGRLLSFQWSILHFTFFLHLVTRAPSMTCSIILRGVTT